MSIRAELVFDPGKKKPLAIDHVQVPGVGRRMAIIVGPISRNSYPVAVDVGGKSIQGMCSQDKSNDWVFSSAEDQAAALLAAMKFVEAADDRRTVTLTFQEVRLRGTDQD